MHGRVHTDNKIQDTYVLANPFKHMHGRVHTNNMIVALHLQHTHALCKKLLGGHHVRVRRRKVADLVDIEEGCSWNTLLFKLAGG